MSKEQVVLCDLDGTLSDHNGKRGHYEYEKVGEDDPIWNVIRVVQKLQEHWPIIFVSGREDSCREESIKWLNEYFLWTSRNFESEFYMRKTGDHRQDYIIKEEIYREHIEPNYDVLCVFEDRTQVVKLWRRLGLTCFQVAEGDF